MMNEDDDKNAKLYEYITQLIVAWRHEAARLVNDPLMQPEYHFAVRQVVTYTHRRAELIEVVCNGTS